MTGSRLKIGRHEVDITNPDKLYFPRDGITKGELVEYYCRIAEYMVPHLKDRPVTLHRFPEGIEGKGFYQQSVPENLPAWVDRATVKKDGGKVTHFVCNKAATLIYMANLGCITPHVWLSRRDRIENPDQMIFDLDPPDDNFETVRRAAMYLKSLLEEIGLEPFLKTTGSRGLHVIVYLKRNQKFDTVRAVARDIARIMANREPAKFTLEQRKDKRGNRLFIDTLRNSYGQTAVAPYAIRAYQGAPVATPLYWEELEQSGLTSQSYNLPSILKRMENTGDPWKFAGEHPQSLEHARRRIEALLRESRSRRSE